MSKLDKAAVFVGILVSLGGLYDAYHTRKRNKENDKKDKEIEKLKEKLAKLENEEEV